MTLRTRISALLLAATAICPLGCATGQAVQRLWNYESIEDEPITLSVSGPVAVDIDSMGGDIRITADETLREGTVIVRREARHGFTRRGDAKRALKDLEYDVKVVSSASGPRLEIRTRTVNVEPHFLRTHLQISLPGVDGLTVHDRIGTVEAVGIEGAVHIETTEGDVRVMTNRPIWRAVTVVNRDGDIDYRVRGESTGEFDCRTVGGQVLYRAREGRFIVNGTTGDTLQATLNGGENPVQLLTTDGNVRVAVVADPTAVGEVIVDP
jgi:hypothetical protein